MYKNCTWDERYQAGKEALPWDNGEPAPELVSYYESLEKKPARVLEIGCGTGTNAIWMAQQGSTVAATEISPTALEAAKKKCDAAGVKVDIHLSDIVDELPVPGGSADFVFDRGVFHVMPAENREVFVDRVAAALAEGGHWLCLAGNADEIRDPEEEGPPQLKAADLINNIEGKFELHLLERGAFTLPNGIRRLAWKALFRKRPG